MSADRAPRDRVPDRGSAMWRPVPPTRLLATALVAVAIAAGCFWWSGIDHSRKGPVFLMALGAVAACIAMGSVLLILWHGWGRLRHRKRQPS
jgi:cell division protein FtsW (lipid II flippase)